MIKGKTKSGFSFSIEEESLDNFELIEVLQKADENPIHLPKLLDMLLGEEQKNRLYDHLRTEKGNVPIEKVVDEITDIFSASSDTKN